MKKKQEQIDYEIDSKKLQQAVFQPTSPPNSPLERGLLAVTWGIIGTLLVWGGLPLVLMGVNGAGEGANALKWTQRVMIAGAGLVVWLLGAWFFMLAYQKFRPAKYDNDKDVAL